MLQDRYKADYEKIHLPSESDKYNSASEDDDEVSGDPNDPDYKDPDARHQRKGDKSKTSDGTLRAMDTMFLLSMLVRGTIPEEVAEKHRRQQQQAELHVQEARRTKVQQWLDDSGGQSAALDGSA